MPKFEKGAALIFVTLIVVLVASSAWSDGETIIRDQFGRITAVVPWNRGCAGGGGGGGGAMFVPQYQPRQLPPQVAIGIDLGPITAVIVSQDCRLRRPQPIQWGYVGPQYFGGGQYSREYVSRLQQLEADRRDQLDRDARQRARDQADADFRARFGYLP